MRTIDKYALKALFFSAPIPLTVFDGVNFFPVDIVFLVFFVLRAITAPALTFSRSLAVPIFFIVFAYSLSGLRSTDAVLHFVGLAQYVFVFSMLLFIHSISNSGAYFNSCARAFLSGTAVAISITLLAYWGLVDPWFKLYTAARVGGVWENPNILMKQLSLYILLAVIIMFGNFKISNIEFIIHFFGICGAVYLGALAASFGGLASYGVALVLIAVYFLKAFGLKTKLASVAVLIGIVTSPLYLSIESYLPDTFVMRVLSVESLDDAGSGSDKLGQILSGIENFLSSPLIGLGVENGRFANTERMIAGSDFISFHSFFVLVANEGGIIALVSFFLIFAFLYKRPSENKDEKTLRNLLLIMFIFNLVIVTNIYSRFFWFPVALLLLSSFPRGALSDERSVPLYRVKGGSVRMK